MTEETFVKQVYEPDLDFKCSGCEKKGKQEDAVVYCEDCRHYLCQLCTDNHAMFSAMEHHILVEACQRYQASGQSASLAEFSPEQHCTKHKGKPVDMYCERHNAVGCSQCFIEDHKCCDNSHIFNITDKIDAIYDLPDCEQTHSRLKDMMVSMHTVCESKDTQLQILNEAKIKALSEVENFEKALEDGVRKRAESSRQCVENEYKKLENEILQDKRNVDVIRENLQTNDRKLNQSNGNRVQHFIGAKIAKENIQEAESEKMKQEINPNTEVQISFIPDEQLMEFVKAPKGIGQIQKHGKPKTNLYRFKGSRDINIKHFEDSETCLSSGCCLTQNYHQLLVSDRNNKRLKRIDIRKRHVPIVDYCTLDSEPIGVCCISDDEVAVACMDDNKIQFVSIQDKMVTTKEIKVAHRCYGIAFKDDKLYVTDWEDSLYVYDRAGALLNLISKDNDGNSLIHKGRHVTFNHLGNRMFVGGENGVVCFDGDGNYLTTVTVSDVQFANCVCVDGRGNLFVSGYYSHNVVQYSENWKKVGVVLKQEDGLKRPASVCFLGPKRMLVTMDDCDVAKLYEVE